jgi:hypothetical protein
MRYWPESAVRRWSEEIDIGVLGHSTCYTHASHSVEVHAIDKSLIVLHVFVIVWLVWRRGQR